VPLSSDPDARARQVANLRPGDQKASNREQHGAYSEKKLAPLRERYRTDLRGQFPSAGEDELIIQAGRLAQMDVLQQFLDAHGPIRHHRRGETFPAAQLLASVTSAYERRRDLLAERERAKAEDPFALYHALEAKYAHEDANADDAA
jgi:hypothetical protein